MRYFDHSASEDEVSPRNSHRKKNSSDSETSNSDSENENVNEVKPERDSSHLLGDLIALQASSKYTSVGSDIRKKLRHFSYDLVRNIIKICKYEEQELADLILVIVSMLNIFDLKEDQTLSDEDQKSKR